MNDILEIKNLTKKYADCIALNNVNLTLSENKIVGLLGPNGSGKTTLIKIIAGLTPVYDGNIKILGNSPGDKANAYISYLPDKEYLPSWVKVEDALSFFRDFYSDFDITKSREMLASMSIPLTKPIKTLSKGMKEKLQLSLIMSRSAKLYLLDEPIAAVDPASRDFILKTILNNYADGSTVLISTHIISDIEPSLNQVLFLKNGEIILNEDADILREEKEKSIDDLFREVFRC